MRLCALFGNPVGHSLSPLIHNHLFKKYNLAYYYEAFEIFDLKKAVDFLRANELRGVSITIPFKTEIIQYLDDLSVLAQQVAAVNTIVNNNGRLFGDNTDCFGIIEALKRNHCDLQNKNAVVIGSGGAALAAIFSILSTFKLKSLTIVARNNNKLQEIIGHLKKAKFYNLCEIKIQQLTNAKYSLKIDDDFIFNATSVGMHPNISDCIVDFADTDCLNLKDKIFFDVVYNPRETEMLKLAAMRGAKIIGGLDMFIYQALKQHYLWTDNQATYQDIFEVLN